MIGMKRKHAYRLLALHHLYGAEIREHQCRHCGHQVMLDPWQLKRMPTRRARCRYGPRMRLLEWLFNEVDCTTKAP